MTQAGKTGVSPDPEEKSSVGNNEHAASLAVSYLSALSRAANSGTPSREILAMLCRLGAECTGAAECRVFLRESRALRAITPDKAAEGGPLVDVSGLPEDIWQVLSKADPIIAASRDQAEAFGILWPEQPVPGTILAVPLVSGGEVRGLVVASNSSRPGGFRRQEVEFLQTLSDVAGLAMRAHELVGEARLARVDALTEIANYRAFQSDVEALVEAAENAGEPVSLLLVELDQFGVINDTHGHQVGNEILQQVARDLSRLVRDSDRIARWGGDEFAILMPGAPKQAGMEAAQRLAEHVRRRPFRFSGHEPIPVTVSVSVATFPEDAQAPEALFEAADRALYEAKELGAGMVCPFEPYLAEIAPRYQKNKTSLVDSLTGLYTRSYFKHRLSVETRRTVARGMSGALIMADLDDFAGFNEREGADRGDQLLIEAAEVFRNVFSMAVVLGRYSGEEFVAFIRSVDQDQVAVLGEKFLQQIRSLDTPGVTGQPVGYLTSSLGVAFCPEDGVNSEELLMRADLALVKAKDQGKDRLCMHGDRTGSE